MLRVDVRPEMLRWARERADASLADLRSRFPKLEAWERGESRPTLKQLESFAKVTFTPFGFFFFPTPPDEPIPIPDLRTMRNARVTRPSVNLLDTIYQCRQRQDWYREYATSAGDDPLAFVGSATLNRAAASVAEDMRRVLRFGVDQRRTSRDWSEALRLFIEHADAAGVLVMCSGTVQNNTHRKLDPQEFRGLALSDPLAPLVFINGADSKSAQMFTLAHELAHVWLGETALSDSSAERNPTDEIERWCNAVAAEVLVPLPLLEAELRASSSLEVEVPRLVRHFKVSSLVILRRLYDVGHIPADAYESVYESELQRILALPKGSGGNFHLTQTARVSRRFARALIESTLEGNTLYRDAFRLLGIRKSETFLSYGRSLGYAI